jgi:sodium-dependent dicarboxylate transporter 2/3/5
VYSSGELTVKTMVREGIVLNIIVAFVVTAGVLLTRT